MALFGEDFDLAFGDLNSSLMPSENAVFNFSMKEAYEILAKEHRILDTYFANILIVVYVILVLMGLFSNTMVWLVVARRAQMRTPRNFYVVNLTVSDISLCLISMPFTLINFIQMQWKLGEAMCKLVPVVQGTNIFVGTGTVMAIALDRYFTIVRSKGAPQDSTRVLLSIALIWIVSCLFTLPIIFYQVLEEESIGGYIVASHCIEKWPTSSMRAAYTVGILVFQLLIPILVLAVVHVAIANHLNSHRLTTNNSGGKEGAGGGGGSVGRNGSLKGSTLKKISKSSIFRIRSKKKHQHMILDDSHTGVPGKRTILNGNDNELYNISSDDACKFLQPPPATMAIETGVGGVGCGGKQNSARVTDYEQQTSNGFPLNGSNAIATPPAAATTITEGNPMEIASPTAPATTAVLEPDSSAISLRPGRITGERGKDDRRDLEGRHSCGETNTNLPNPFQVKFKSNIGVCITFREFCQLSDGKTNNNGHKKRIELANHNNAASSPSKIQGNGAEVERKFSHTGCQSEASDKTSPRTSSPSSSIGNERHDAAFLVGPITDEKLNGSAQVNGNSTTIVMPVSTTAFAPSPSGNKNGSSSSKRTKKELARNKRTTIILLLVSVIFTVSWLPWHLLTLWADLYPNFTSTSNLYMLYAGSHIIAMSSAVTNAVLYGWLNTNLRRELTQMISGWCKRS